MGEYPFPGCCPHSFNAHDRRHCTACDCTRPPVQVGTAGPSAEPTPTGEQEWADLRECGVCHALVLAASRPAHLDWHEAVLRTVDNLLDATTVLAQDGKPRKKKKEIK